jgi:hypothetical protein
VRKGDSSEDAERIIVDNLADSPGWPAVAGHDTEVGFPIEYET